MSTFNTAQKIAKTIVNKYSSADIKNELYQLLILQMNYNEAVKISNEIDPKNYESELRSLILMMSNKQITEMSNDISSVFSL